MAEGVVTRESPHSVAQTLERIERTIADRGLAVFARVDHRAGASDCGLEMQEATVLTFGNPRLGTPAMVSEPLLALDLPLRVLVWEQDGQTRISWQEPAFVARRFGVAPDIPAHVPALIAAALESERPPARAAE